MLLGDKHDNHIKGDRVYINIQNTSDSNRYYSIINLLANDLAKKYSDKDVDTITKRLEQIAYNLGYLSTQI